MPTSLSSSLQKLTSELNLFWFYGYCDQTCSNVKPVVPCKWFPVRGFMSLLRQCLSVWSLKQQFYGVCGLAGPPTKRKYSRRKNWKSIPYSPRIRENLWWYLHNVHVDIIASGSFSHCRGPTHAARPWPNTALSPRRFDGVPGPSAGRPQGLPRSPPPPGTWALEKLEKLDEKWEVEHTVVEP